MSTNHLPSTFSFFHCQWFFFIKHIYTVNPNFWFQLMTIYQPYHMLISTNSIKIPRDMWKHVGATLDVANMDTDIHTLIRLPNTIFKISNATHHQELDQTTCWNNFIWSNERIFVFFYLINVSENFILDNFVIANFVDKTWSFISHAS